MEMNLKSYLANIDMNIKDFAKKIGYNSMYISCVIHKKKIPSKRLSMAIEAATNGVVKIQSKKKEEATAESK
jgi:hypothetical protein